jgi:FkbM family methyltransferase
MRRTGVSGMTQPQDPKLTLEKFEQQMARFQMQLVRTRQIAVASQAELALMREGRKPRFPIEFTSQFGEDLFAWQLLGCQLDGFFIEAGAFDGYHYSVTHGFEAVGWKGLLVEPLPGPFELCKQRRTGSRVVHGGLSRNGSTGTTTFTSMVDQYGGMLSHLVPNEIHKDYEHKTTIEVPITSLNALLENHVGPIDLVSIDVEGSELDVLDGFDLERFKPRIIMLEDNTGGEDLTLYNYMMRFPYDLVTTLAVNDVYIRRGQEDIMERLRWMKLG